MDYPRHMSLGGCRCHDCVHLSVRDEAVMVNGVIEHVEVPFCWVKRVDVMPNIPRPCSYYADHTSAKEDEDREFDVVVMAVHVYRVEAKSPKEATNIALERAAADLEEYADVLSVSRVEDD